MAKDVDDFGVYDNEIKGSQQNTPPKRDFYTWMGNWFPKWEPRYQDPAPNVDSTHFDNEVIVRHKKITSLAKPMYKTQNIAVHKGREPFFGNRVLTCEPTSWNSNAFKCDNIQ